MLGLESPSFARGSPLRGGPVRGVESARRAAWGRARLRVTPGVEATMHRVRYLFPLVLLPLLASCSREDRLPTAPTADGAASLQPNQSATDEVARGVAHGSVPKSVEKER